MDIPWRSTILPASIMTALIAAGVPAQAGPCTADISSLQKQAALLAPAASGPTATQSVGAQLHHQPTPEDVQHAERQANVAADAALDRARKADERSDAAGCQEALNQARELYGLANN